MQDNLIEPRIVKRLGLTASFGVLAFASIAYGQQAADAVNGTYAKISAFGMSSLPGVIAMAALASFVSASNRRQGAMALAVGAGALGIQCANGASYWTAADARVMASKASLANAEQALRVHQVTPSDPIRAQVEGLVEEGGPVERRKIRAQRRELRAELAKAEATEIAHTQLRVRVEAAKQEVSQATSTAQPFVWARSFVLTAIEALGPGAMALSAAGKGVPAPAPAPQSDVRPGALLARRRWDKRTVINEIPA